MAEYPQVIRHRISIGGGSAAFIEAELNPYGEGKCPECGTDLTTVDPRAEANFHWGGEPLPVQAENYLARARKAVLLGEDLPKE